MQWVDTGRLLVAFVVDHHHSFCSSSRHDLGPKVRLFLHRPFEFIHWVHVEVANVALAFTLNASLDVSVTFESNNFLLEIFDRLIQISFCQLDPLRIGLVLFIKQNLSFFKHIYLVQDILLETSDLGTCLYVNFHNVFGVVWLKGGRSFLVLLFFFDFYFFMLFILPLNRFLRLFTVFIHNFFLSLLFLFIRINLFVSAILRLFSLVFGLRVDVRFNSNCFFFGVRIFWFDQIGSSKVLLNELHFYLLYNFGLSDSRGLRACFSRLLTF